MKDNYDFSDAIKNPFAEKIKGKYNVLVTYDFIPKDGEDIKDCQPSPDALVTFEEDLK